MKKLGRPPCMLDIVEEHFEELDFLWEQRESVIFAPDWTLADLAELEDRAEAHLDGLRLAELHAVDLARTALSGEETFAATAATFVLMETGDPALADEVIAAFEEAETPELRDGIRIGLRHSVLGEATRRRLFDLAGGGESPLAIGAADVLAFHRIQMDRAPRDGLHAERARDRALWLEVCGRLRTLREGVILDRALADPEPEVRWAALRAAAMSGMPGLPDRCRAATDRSPDPAAEPIEMLGVVGDFTDADALMVASRDVARAGAAFAGLGALGRIDVVPWLIERMENEVFARPAVAAVVRITGLPVENAALEVVETTTGSDEDDAEPPMPDARHAALWWARNEERFDAGSRWQAGLSLGAAWGPSADLLPLAGRRDWYLALASRSEGAARDIELEAKVPRQRQ